MPLNAGRLRLACGSEPLFDAIWKRYVGRWNGWPGMSLLFQRLRPAALVQPQHHYTRLHLAPPQRYYTRLHLAPRLALTVLAQPWMSEPQPAEATITKDHPSRQTGAPAHSWDDASTRQPRVRIETTAVEQVVRRLVRRGERIESVDAPRPRSLQSARPEGRPDTPRGAVVSSRQPVERVVRRTAVSQPTPHPMFAGGRPAPPVVEWPSSPTSIQSREPAPVDLDRLTERVVQAIDRRVLAYRERTGRI